MPYYYTENAGAQKNHCAAPNARLARLAITRRLLQEKQPVHSFDLHEESWLQYLFAVHGGWIVLGAIVAVIACMFLFGAPSSSTHSPEDREYRQLLRDMDDAKAEDNWRGY